MSPGGAASSTGPPNRPGGPVWTGDPFSVSVASDAPHAGVGRAATTLGGAMGTRGGTGGGVEGFGGTAGGLGAAGARATAPAGAWGGLAVVASAGAGSAGLGLMSPGGAASSIGAPHCSQ